MWLLTLLVPCVIAFTFPWTSPLLNGKLEELECDVQTLSRMNEKLHLKLQDLKKRKFFTYFKVKLDGKCPFWAMDYFCEQATCAVCECVEEEIPITWKEESSDLANRDPSYGGWKESQKAWIFEEEPDIYVNLLRNAEAFTFYQGQHIWNAIYNENCFGAQKSGSCYEERLFYQIISGLHTNINTHISYNYVFKPNASNLADAMELTYPNVSMFHDRVATHPDRIRNFYVAFALLIRSVSKAANMISQFPYETGDREDDLLTSKLIADMLNLTSSNCPQPFNEAQLFSQPSGVRIIVASTEGRDPTALLQHQQNH